jgi:hypothetical protein
MIDKFFTWYKIFSLKIFFRIVFLQVVRKITFKNSFISYSLSGEDYILHNFFVNQSNGFYIDVGCNDPIRNSNTFFFYSKGWRGLNIDINPKKIDAFKKYRPKDISIIAAISDSIETKKYYTFSSDSVNTIDESKIEDYKKCWKLTGESMVITQSLSEILDERLPPFQAIDFLSIDVEGMDFNVLKSLDLNKYVPKIIIIEIHNFNIMNAQNDEIVKYLTKYNYRLVAYVTMNAYFKKADV